MWPCFPWVILSTTARKIFAFIFPIDNRKNVLASAKHFVGDGGTEKGTNEGNTITSYDDLERIHLAPYLDCLSQGVCTVMASYSSWNGKKLHTDHFLLTEVLKKKLGFMVNIIDYWNILYFAYRIRWTSNFDNYVFIHFSQGKELLKKTCKTCPK